LHESRARRVIPATPVKTSRHESEISASWRNARRMISRRADLARLHGGGLLHGGAKFRSNYRLEAATGASCAA
jgi:hypothetical protein